MAYDLERIAETVKVLREVEERKRQAQNYSSMASRIARELGKTWGDHGKTHEYQEDGLKVREVECVDRDSDYRGSFINIRSPKTNIVFYSTSSGEITAYRPGDWEKRLLELYEPLKPQKQPKEERGQMVSMTEWELRDLKKRFGLE